MTSRELAGVTCHREQTHGIATSSSIHRENAGNGLSFDAKLLRKHFLTPPQHQSGPISASGLQVSAVLGPNQAVWV